MRLLYIITSLSLGGAETQLVRVATRLKTRGWDIMVVSLLPPRTYVGLLESTGIPVISLGIKNKIPNPNPLWKLTKITHSWKPHIVHSWMVHANLLARISRLLIPMPILICSAHSIIEKGKHGSGRLRELLYRLTDPLCDLTTHVSKAGLERYIRIRVVPKDKIRYVPNGIDTKKFKPDPELRKLTRHKLGLPKTTFVWLAVGGFRPAKDYPSMLQAFAKVVKNRSQTILLIAGDGILRGEIERLAVDLGLKGKVKFLGNRSDIPALMNAADAYVMSSLREGLPNVLLEAGACGLPIVATDVGGNREAVLNGYSGILVPPGNVSVLAEAMEKIMALPAEKRKAMGMAGRKHIQANFDIEHVVSLWENLYKEVWERCC